MVGMTRAPKPGYQWVLILPALLVVLAGSAGPLAAQQEVAGTAAPAATPAPTPTAAPTVTTPRPPVRLVFPSPDAKPELGQPLPLNPADFVETPPAGEAKKAPENELVIAPLPLSNPAIGTGLGLAVVYTIARKQADTKSPPTTLGGGGFYTDSDSWAGGAGVKLYMKEDRYRATLGGALGKVNYKLFSEGPTGRGIPIKQEAEGVLGELMVGLGKRWYAGLRASYGTTTVGLQKGASGTIPVPPAQLDVTLAVLGLKGERDNRDSVFYPTAGSRLELLVSHSDASFGSDYTYTKTTLSYSDYLKLGEPVVLAWQVAGCNASENAPFFDVCLFGTDSMLRGYTAGRYLDHWTVGTQLELRWRFAHRWVTTAFVGVGEVKPTYSLSDGTEVLPAGGVGLQWIAAPENMITVRADYAVGKDSSDAFYIGIGQAF
jgi:outer membrane protein assembly factor BamA